MAKGRGIMPNVCGTLTGQKLTKVSVLQYGREYREWDQTEVMTTAVCTQELIKRSYEISRTLIMSVLKKRL